MKSYVIAIMVFVGSFAFAKTKTNSDTSTDKPINYSDPATIRGMALSPYKTPATPTANDINVVVPRSAIPLEREDYESPVDHYMFELNASTWLPKNYSSDASTINTSNYDTAKVPKTSFNVETEGWTNSKLTLRPKYGMSFAQLSRSGQLPTGGQNVNVTEHLNMYSVRAGLELTTAKGWHHMKPLAELAVLPTWEQAQASAFTNGISKNAMLIEGQIGGTVRLTKSEVLGTRSISLEAGLETSRDLGDSSLAATGVFGGLRAEL